VKKIEKGKNNTARVGKGLLSLRMRTRKKEAFVNSMTSRGTCTGKEKTYSGTAGQKAPRKNPL